jgi:hypothetical protein
MGEIKREVEKMRRAEVRGQISDLRFQKTEGKRAEVRFEISEVRGRSWEGANLGGGRIGWG